MITLLIFCIVVPPELSGERRRSSRVRLRPTEWWLGERVLYE